MWNSSPPNLTPKESKKYITSTSNIQHHHHHHPHHHHHHHQEINVKYIFPIPLTTKARKVCRPVEL